MHNDQVYNPTTYSPTQQPMAYGNMSLEAPAVHSSSVIMDPNELHSPLLSPRKDFESGNDCISHGLSQEHRCYRRCYA